MQNAAENEDLRRRRSKKLMQDALIELTVEKGFAAITVRDIVERAMVNRSTFYRHYVDKYDMLEKYMRDVVAIISDKEFIAEKTSPKASELRQGLVNLMKHVQQFAAFYRVMLGAKGDAFFIQKFRENTERLFRHVLNWNNSPPDPNAPPLDMQLNYISSAGIGVILWWLENDQPCSPEQLAAWLGQLSSNSIGITMKDVKLKKAKVQE